MANEELPFFSFFFFLMCVPIECVLFNSSPPSAAYMRQLPRSELVQVMACRLFGAKPLSKPMLDHYQLHP